MTKKLIVVALTIFFMHSLAAQDSRIRLKLGGGVSPVQESFIGENGADFLSPTSTVENFKDLWNPDFNINGGLEYNAFSHLILTVDFSYHQYSFNESEMTKRIKNDIEDGNLIPFNKSSLITDGGEVDFYLFTLGFKSFLQLSKLRFFVNAGAGLAYLKMQSVSFTYYDQPFETSQDIVAFYQRLEETDNTAFQMSGGLGMEYAVSKRIRVFSQVDYSLIFSKNSSTILTPVKFGLLLPLN